MRHPRSHRILPTLVLVAATALALACGGSDGPTEPGGNNGGGGGGNPVGIVSGTVTAGGSGVPGATLRLTRSGSGTLSATTDGAGAFAFSSVAVGTWALTLTVPDAFEATGEVVRSVNVTDGGTATASFTLEAFDGETIDLVDNAFQPSSLTVSAGTEVRWRATTNTFHTVTPDGHSAFSRAEAGSVGTVLRATFGTPGTYAYFCEPHRDQGMTGEVTVN